MGFAGHLAAGMGCFKFVDLDTPSLLSEDPVLEGYEVSGAVYKFRNARGHGGFLHWDNIACLQFNNLNSKQHLMAEKKLPGMELFKCCRIFPFVTSCCTLRNLSLDIALGYMYVSARKECCYYRDCGQNF